MNIRLVLFLMLLLLIVALFLAPQFGLYYRFYHFDTLLHTIGGFLVAWLVAIIILNSRTKKTKVRKFVEIMLGVIAAGIFWEIAEKISSIYGRDYAPLIYKYFHAGNFEDTIIDVVADLVGGLIFTISYIFIKNK